ncbi:MAG: hypothetical protein ACLQBA_09260 [Candidatus Binataceae bacterium]
MRFSVLSLEMICVAALSLAGAAPTTAQQAASKQVPKPKVSCKAYQLYGSMVEPKDVPAEFAAFVPFIPNGQDLIDLLCGDIKGDGSTTYLLVTRAPGDIGSLSLLTRESDGSLKLEASNNTVIQSSELTGSAGGYRGVDIIRNGFTIRNSFGGGGIGEAYSFTFKYSRIHKTWMLESVEVADYDSVDRPPINTTKKWTKAQFGHVTFSDFDGKAYGIYDPANP